MSTKNYDTVSYCVGCNIIGLPVYVTHFIDKRQNPNAISRKAIGTPVENWRRVERHFKHEHNN